VDPKFEPLHGRAKKRSKNMEEERPDFVDKDMLIGDSQLGIICQMEKTRYLKVENNHIEK
jgi:hypothetical protein